MNNNNNSGNDPTNINVVKSNNKEGEILYHRDILISDDHDKVENTLLLNTPYKEEEKNEYKRKFIHTNKEKEKINNKNIQGINDIIQFILKNIKKIGDEVHNNIIM